MKITHDARTGLCLACNGKGIHHTWDCPNVGLIVRCTEPPPTAGSIRDPKTGRCTFCGRLEFHRIGCPHEDGTEVLPRVFAVCDHCGGAEPYHAVLCPAADAAEDVRRAEGLQPLADVAEDMAATIVPRLRPGEPITADPNASLARTTAAELAAQISDIVGERGNNYGPPEVNFANIAAFWRAWVQARHGIMIPFDGADVGHMSALIKVARVAQTPTHRDSALDGAVYTMLGLGCALADAK